jgi:YbbR domain-containing protein
MPDKGLFSLKDKKIKWGYLALAFVLSVSLWIYVTVQDNPTVEQLYEVSIDYVNLSENFALSDKTETVKVRVSGSSSVINNLTASDINVYADLSSAVLGQYTVKLNFDLPNSVQFVSSDKSEVTLLIKELQQVQKPVMVEYVGSTPANGYMLLDPTVSPNEIVLSGPEDKLALIDKVYVSVDLSETDTTYRATLPVNVVDSSGNSLLYWVTPQPALLDVLVPVVSEQPSKVAPISVTLSGEPADGYVVSRIVIDPSVTTVYGVQSVLDKVDYVYTSAVNIKDATSNVTQEVTLLNLDGVNVDKTAVYQVVVVVERQATKTISDVALTLTNVNSDYNYQLEQNTCDVEVSGPVSAVNSITNTGLEARIDVSSLTPGSMKANVQVTTNSNVQVNSISPRTVNIEVTQK